MERTELARERTFLALIRTGLAFLSLGIGFLRYFGLSWWSLFDGLLICGSVVMVTWGAVGYFRVARLIRELQARLRADPGFMDLLG